MGPNVYIIAGPNGIGKTTFAREFLPHFADCRNFVNADLIAQGVSPFSPEAAAFRSSCLHQVASLARRSGDFGLRRDLKKAGCGVKLFFLGTPKVEVALSSVAERVRKGGHDVPASIIRRRFDRSITLAPLRP